MNAQRIELRSATRTYRFAIADADADVLTDRIGRKLRPHSLEVSITDTDISVSIHGTHIKKSGELGLAERYVYWWFREDDGRSTGRYVSNEAALPKWIAQNVHRCQLHMPINGPRVWPASWQEAFE